MYNNALAGNRQNRGNVKTSDPAFPCCAIFAPAMVTKWFELLDGHG